MLRTKVIIFVLLLGLAIHSCIDRYVPVTNEYDYAILIHGTVTDDPGVRPVVKITSSTPLDYINSFKEVNKENYISGADVYLLCDDGEEYLMEYTDSGNYRLNDPLFIAETGKSYKLIIYSDEEIFESEFIQLLEATSIDSINYNAENRKLTFDGAPVDGYAFLISNRNENPTPSYYRWQVEITYNYRVPYRSDYIWQGEQLVPYNNDSVISCWKTIKVPGVFISNTQGFNENTVTKAPLHFQSQYGDELSIRYSVFVRQLTVNEECYRFWESLDRLLHMTGGIYGVQPFRLSGNIKCTSNPDIVADGIFEVAGVSEKRVFFDSPDEFRVFQYDCGYDTIGIQYQYTSWDDVPENSFIKYDGLYNLFMTSDIECFDCTSRGGTNEEPPFWEY